MDSPPAPQWSVVFEADQPERKRFWDLALRSESEQVPVVSNVPRPLVGNAGILAYRLDFSVLSPLQQYRVVTHAIAAAEEQGCTEAEILRVIAVDGLPITAEGTRLVPRELRRAVILRARRGKELYVYIASRDDRAEHLMLSQCWGRHASDPELSLDWWDATRLNAELLGAQHPGEIQNPKS